MSGSFAELWNSTAPTASKQQTRTLGSATPNTNNNTNNNGYAATKSSQYDAFSILASSSRPSSRSITPASRNQQQQQQQHSANAKPSATLSSPAGSGKAGAGDAFSSLLDASYTFSSANGGNMSIAERQAASEKARRDMVARRDKERKEQEVIWSGLDKIALSNTVSRNGIGNGIGLGGDLLNLVGDATTSSSTAISKHIDDNNEDDDDWGLSDFSSAPTPSTSHSQSQSQTQSTLLTFDALDEFISSPPSQPQPQPQSKPQSKSQIHSEVGIKNTSSSQDEFEFDFGDREYKFSPDDENDNNASEYGDGDEDDNILRESSNPVLVSPQSQSNSTRPRSRAPSPPPHVLGQLVEMGFSLEQARTALASTESGIDVGGALEVLVAAQEQECEREEDGVRVRVQQRKPLKQERQERHPTRPTRRTAPTTTTTFSSSNEPPSNSTSTSSLPTLSTFTTNINLNINKENIQQHADKLLAQASGIGMSVLKGAGVFWRERVGGGTVISGSGGSNWNNDASKGNTYMYGEGGMVKPKWMVDRERDQEEENENDGNEGGEREAGGFKDDDDFDRIPQATFIDFSSGPIRRGKEKEKGNGIGSNDLVGGVKASDGNEKGKGMKTTTGDLFSEGGAGYSYTSPARRRSKPTMTSSSIASSSTTVPSSSSHSHSQLNPNLTQNKSIPKPKPIIATHPLPPNILTTLQEYKLTANQKFREGAYGDAEVYYTRGIDSISTPISSENEIGKIGERQLWKMVLLNNRALVKLKNGDADGALGDCESVLRILSGVLPSGNGEGGGGEVEFDRTVSSSFYEIPLSSFSNTNANNEAETIDLKQTFQKAHRRRAEALEMRERWREAGEGWGVFVKRCWWVGEKERGEVRRCLERCRRMGGGSSSNYGEGATIGDGMSKPKQTHTKKRPPTSAATTALSSTAKALHASNLALEVEDLQKHALKDSIDLRIHTWLSGKESNIRALLASLDTVLWDELRWQKVGMHELVTDKQVKIGYLKAIARVHPDKLNVNNTTLEQRMIANGVFAALNEAWISFKQ